MVCLYLCVCVYTSGSSKWCVCTCVCVFTQVEAVNGVSVPMYVCVCLHKWKQ